MVMMESTLEFVIKTRYVAILTHGTSCTLLSQPGCRSEASHPELHGDARDETRSLFVGQISGNTTAMYWTSWCSSRVAAQQVMQFCNLRILLIHDKLVSSQPCAPPIEHPVCLK